MEHLCVSKTAVEQWNSQDGIESLKNYEKENQQLSCIKFDGGTEKVAIGHNQCIPRHLLTLMKEGFETPNPKYIHHEECGKSGLEMAACVFSEITATNSSETLVALGFGENLFIYIDNHNKHFKYL